MVSQTPAGTLEGTDAATVHESYGRRGALPSRIKPLDAGFRICAPAFTVDCPTGDNLWIHRAAKWNLTRASLPRSRSKVVRALSCTAI